MIAELHQKPFRHIKTDQATWATLRDHLQRTAGGLAGTFTNVIATVPPTNIAFSGVPVYTDRCPCDG